jgi:hypothetical protein
MINNYKQLKEYQTQRLNEITKENKVFYAFSMEQLNEGIKEIGLDINTEKLAKIGYGGYLPSQNLEKFQNEMETLNLELKALVISNPALKKELIKYELANHEAYYCYDSYLNAVETIKSFDYEITNDEIQSVYSVESKKYDF